MGETVLQCKIPRQMRNEMEQIAIWHDLKLGQCYSYLCLLAMKHPDSRKIDYDGHIRDVPCRMKASADFMESAKSYRAKHVLVNKSEFFFDALSRGINIHKENNN